MYMNVWSRVDYLTASDRTKVLINNHPSDRKHMVISPTVPLGLDD